MCQNESSITRHGWIILSAKFGRIKARRVHLSASFDRPERASGKHEKWPQTRSSKKKKNDKNRSSLQCIRNYYGGLSSKHITRRPKCSFSDDIYPFASPVSLKRRGVRGHRRQMDRVCLFVWPASRSTLIGQRRGSSRLFAWLVSATDLACSDGIPDVFQGRLKNEKERKKKDVKNEAASSIKRRRDASCTGTQLQVVASAPARDRQEVLDLTAGYYCCYAPHSPRTNCRRERSGRARLCAHF